MCKKFRLRFSLLLCAAFCVNISASCAQEANVTSLGAVVQESLQGHPYISAAQAGLDAAQKDIQIEKSAYFPEISASAGVGRVYQDNATSRGLTVDRGAAYSNYKDGSVSMRQLLFDGFETSGRVQAARAQSLSARENFKDAQEQIVMRAGLTYINLYRINMAIGLLNELAQDADDYLERIKSLVNDGAADESELQQAMDVRYMIDSNLSDYQGQLDVVYAAYREVTGHDPAGDYAEPPMLSDKILSEPDEAVALALGEAPVLKAAQYDYEASADGVQVAKAAYYPDVTGELSYNKATKKEVIGGDSVDGRALVRMNWSFSTGMRQNHSVGQSKMRAQESKAREEDLARSLERDIRQAYAQRKAYLNKKEILEKRVKLNEGLLKTLNTQYDGGRVSLLNIMRTQSQFYNARLEQLENSYAIMSEEYTILAQTGRLTDSILNADNVIAQEDASSSSKGPDLESQKLASGN